MVGSAGESYSSRYSAHNNKITYSGVCSSWKSVIWTNKPKAPGICSCFQMCCSRHFHWFQDTGSRISDMPFFFSFFLYNVCL